VRPQAYEVMFTQDEGGIWLVEVPTIPGVHSHGETLSEARRHILDALGLWLEHEDFIVTERFETQQTA
jgi:predicted RNase H-like HicB family nuclease